MLIPKKSLGQNFLLDKNICKKIINLANIKNQIVLEIGPGTGQLTDEIIKKKPKKLILIEKDKNLYNNLRNKYNHLKFIDTFNKDIINFDLDKYNKLIIISNLPYNISVKILLKLLNLNNKAKEIVVMLQKEVAYKLNSNNKIKKNKYNFFIEILSEYKVMFDISNKVFFPIPKIKSSVVKITPKQLKIDKGKLKNFNDNIFKHMRKKIKNNLSIESKDPKIISLLSLRAEDLSTKELLFLFNNF